MAIVCTNPYSEEICGRYSYDQDGQLEEKLGGSEKGFRQLASWSLSKRLDLLGSIAIQLDQSTENLATMMTNEMGKPLVQARAEVKKCAALCRHYQEKGEGYMQERLIETESATHQIQAAPLGHILGIMPWNFPLWQVMRFFVPNWVLGNVVSVKHADNVSGTAGQLAQLLLQAGIPEGCYTDLYLENDRTSDLIADPRIAGVSLTGSTAAGRAVGKAAGAQLKPSVLELGGSDPYLILGDADLKLAAQACVDSRMLNNGQSCIAAKRWIVVEGILDEFLREVASLLSGYAVGDPMAAKTNIGPLARHDLAAGLSRQIKASTDQGATLKTFGNDAPDQGYFIQPGLLLGSSPESPAQTEELFGPIATVIGVRDENEAMAIAGRTSFGLGAGIFTADGEKAQQLARRLRCGVVAINDFVKSHPAVPFGGILDSGYGRELAKDGLMAFANVKSIAI